MRELIAGRLMKDDRPISEKMVELLYDGLAGKIVVSETVTKRGVTKNYASPAFFLKVLLDYMLKSSDLALKLRDAKKQNKGTGGGIRVVLPNPVIDPLLEPGQKPRRLRLLGQDPSKPLPDATGTATDAQPSPGPVPTHAGGGRTPANTRSTSPAIASPERLNQQPPPAPAPNSKDAFDPTELIEDFEHPVCQFCMGIGMVRDENGINMVTCDYCEGKGRAPAPE